MTTITAGYDAGGAHLKVARVENGRVIMEVCDNGQGFDMTQEFPGHLGLKSMRERVERGGGLLDSPHCGAASWESERPDLVLCQRTTGRRYWHHVAPP